MRRKTRVLFGAAVVLAPCFARPARAVEDEARACAAAAESAQTLMQRGELRAARERVLMCARDACPSMIRKDCVQWLAKVEEDLPSFVLDAHDTAGRDVLGVRVLIDGKIATGFNGTAISIDPGVRVLRFEAQGKRPVEEKVMIRQGEKNRRIAVTFEGPSTATPPPPKDPKDPPPPPGVTPQDAPPEEPGARPIAWLLTGTAVVALGAFSYFGLKGIADRRALIDDCNQSGCAQSSIDAVHTKFLVADVALAAGLLSAGAATYFFLAPRDKPTAGASIHGGLAPNAHGAIGTIGGTF